jgi:AraC-like DNA-binding protein/mannose-6-phosphate isomerase-like protein (cupin superfamily)
MKYNNLNYSFTMEDSTYQINMASFNKFDCIVPLHSHSKNSFEIHYIPEGYGTAFISGAEYPICPNTLFITGPYIEHSQTPLLKDPMIEYCIYFKLHVYNNKKIDEVTSSLLANTFWFGLDRQNIHMLLQLIFHELAYSPIGNQQALSSLFQLLMVHVIRNFTTPPISQAAPFSRRILNEPFLLIEESFLNDYQSLTLKQLAERISLSTRQTERLLKQYYNSSFQKKKTEARMAAAASLLKNTSESILSIAEKTGYSSSEHFAHAFKKYYHINASEYRKQLK